MSADICPKCNQQQVRNDQCDACGWYDLEAEQEELHRENERLKARIAELEEAESNRLYNFSLNEIDGEGEGK